MKIEKAKILVVDDEIGLREGLRRIFTSQGHQVDTADNGHEGLEKGIAREYDLYFIDMKMQDMDGFKVLEGIKQKFPESILIIITGYASIDTAVTATRLGAYHYVAKPFTPDDIQILVDRALERRWYILESRRLRVEQEKRLLEVAQEKSRIRTIINSIDDGILVINQQGEIVLFNPRFLTLLGIHQKLAPGQPVLELLPEPLRQLLSEILEKRESLRAIEQELVIEPPFKLVLMANTAPIIDENGNFIGIVSVLRDITELKKVEIVKSQFVNMASHELKAPLNAIQGYLEIVIDRTLGDAEQVYENYLKRSLDRTKTLVNLTNDLLNYSRIEAGKVRREIEKIDLGEILNSVIASLKTEMEKQNLVCELNLPGPLYVAADRDEMQRVFANLVSNAIKYNKPEGSIKITAELDRSYVKIAVSDTGIGLKPEEKERLFEEFFRAKNPMTRNITGTGLGLALTRRIIDAYAGKVMVETEFEQGSTFTVYLPGLA